MALLMHYELQAAYGRRISASVADKQPDPWANLKDQTEERACNGTVSWLIRTDTRFFTCCAYCRALPYWWSLQQELWALPGAANSNSSIVVKLAPLEAGTIFGEFEVSNAALPGPTTLWPLRSFNKLSSLWTAARQECHCY